MKRVPLVFDDEQLCRVMHGAANVVVVADRAIELIIAWNPVKHLCSSSMSCLVRGGDLHARRNQRRAGANEFAVDLHDAGVAGLNRP